MDGFFFYSSAKVLENTALNENAFVNIRISE